MELLNVITARSVWLFDPAEMNPSGKKVMSDIFIWLKEMYKFEKFPASVVDLEDNALVFTRGSFVNKAGLTVGIELKIYKDGILANASSSTRDSEDFTENILSLCATEFGLIYKPEMIRYKITFSELNFHSVKKVLGIYDKVNEFANKISSLIVGEPKAIFDVAGVNFMPSTTIPNYQLSPFIVERKINTMPTENKYYSRAPLHTDYHLRLLEEFEGVFMA